MPLPALEPDGIVPFGRQQLHLTEGRRPLWPINILLAYGISQWLTLVNLVINFRLKEKLAFSWTSEWLTDSQEWLLPGVSCVRRRNEVARYCGIRGKAIWNVGPTGSQTEAVRGRRGRTNNSRLEGKKLDTFLFTTIREGLDTVCYTLTTHFYPLGAALDPSPQAPLWLQ
jgi:hypothetical protein